MVLMLSEMQTGLFRIWTQLAESTPFNANYYTMSCIHIIQILSSKISAHTLYFQKWE